MSRNGILFVSLFVLLLLLFLADLAFGSIRIPLQEMRTALSNNQGNSIYREILLNYRLPKALTAILAGSALSVAGLLMQTLFRNPLAGPDVLGVNAGASLGVALITMFSSGVGSYFLGFGSWGLVVAAVLGATGVLLLVIFASVRVPDLVSLLIIGMMFGYIAGSVVSVLQNISNPDTLKIFVIWTFGSLSAVSWSMMPVLLVVVGLGLCLSFLLQKPLNALLLGENYARGLGVSIPRTRFLIILATSLLAGGVTAFAGPIAFIGITVPHIARGLFGSWNHRVILPASVLCGSCLLLICDIVSQMPGLTTGLPINSVTALFGAPLIIWILLKRK
ncbi:MAG: iron ABC transporter permease [Bacteroidales bacterium]